MLLLFLSVLAFISGLGQCEEEAMLSAVSVNSKYLKQLDTDLAHFVLFFTSWSKYCVRMASDWEALADKYNNMVDRQQVVIGKTDCLLESEFCSSEGVTGFPTIVFYRTGFGVNRVEGERYRGERDRDSLELFLKEALSLDVGLTEKEKVETETDVTVEEGIYLLTNLTFHPTVAQGDTFVQFCPPWSSPCQRLASTWVDLAASLAKDEEGLKIAEIDCNLYAGLCQEEGATVYPTLLYYRNGEMLERYREPRTYGELREFVLRLRYSAHQGEATDQEAAVLVLDRDNFHDWTDEAGLVFILFHADWSRHCKALAPTWERLAQDYRTEEGLMVASIDCNAADNVNQELCSSFGVSGVPSIQILSRGVKIGDYHGGRTLPDLTEMVERFLHPEHFIEEQTLEGSDDDIQ